MRRRAVLFLALIGCSGTEMTEVRDVPRRGVGPEAITYNLSEINGQPLPVAVEGFDRGPISAGTITLFDNGTFIYTLTDGNHSGSGHPNFSSEGTYTRSSSTSIEFTWPWDGTYPGVIDGHLLILPISEGIVFTYRYGP
jgi:hypothetical protein